MMIARQNINEARRMIANQHLASSMAKTMLSGSAGRAKLELLSIYSNMKANELIAPQTEQAQGILTNIHRNRGQIDAKAAFEAPFEVLFDEYFKMRFGKNKVRFCPTCKIYITKEMPCKHVELAPEEYYYSGIGYVPSIEIL
jgi:excinuclease UvrABC ATPase subunit